MNLKRNLYWNNFYSNFSFSKESNFAKFCLKYIKKNSDLLDIACGNGRDTFFFIKNGIKCKGIDISKIAIKNNTKKLKNTFQVMDACTRRFNLKKKYDFIYCRFFLHTINQNSERIFLDNVKKIMKKNSKLFLEFRTTKDPLMKIGKKISNNEVISDHYRRFINVQEFLKEIKKNNFKIFYKASSNNFAKFGNERPHICRIILKKLF